MLSVSTLAYLTYFGRRLREATTRNTSAYAHLRSGGSSSLFLRDRGNGEIKEQRLFPFARPSSPKQKKYAWPQVKVCRLSQLQLSTDSPLFQSTFFVVVVCCAFPSLYSRISKYLKIPIVPRRWANSVIIYLLLTRILNTGLSWERNNSFPFKEVFERETF